MKAISPFTWRRRIAMRDVDAWGIVWYGNYLAFCDEARAELLRAFDLAPGSFPERGLAATVVEIEGRYLAPAHFDEEVDVHVRVQAQRSARMRFDFDIRRSSDETRLAEIRTDLVLVRPNGEVVYLMPDDVRSAVDAMIAAQEKAVDA